MNDVKHQNQKFEEGDGLFLVEKEGERLAKLTYTFRGDKVVSLDHTVVSEALRGQGVARALLLAAMDWVKKEGYKVVPTCSYVKSVFDKTPEWAVYLADESESSP